MKIESNGVGRVASRWRMVAHHDRTKVQSPNRLGRDEDAVRRGLLILNGRGRGVVRLVLRAPVDLFTLAFGVWSIEIF